MLAQPAWLKMLVHVCKHPEDVVGGFLVGVDAEAGPNVEDVYPVFHSLPSPPMLALAAEAVRPSLPAQAP